MHSMPGQSPCPIPFHPSSRQFHQLLPRPLNFSLLPPIHSMPNVPSMSALCAMPLDSCNPVAHLMPSITRSIRASVIQWIHAPLRPCQSIQKSLSIIHAPKLHPNTCPKAIQPSLIYVARSEWAWINPATWCSLLNLSCRINVNYMPPSPTITGSMPLPKIPNGCHTAMQQANV